MDNTAKISLNLTDEYDQPFVGDFSIKLIASLFDDFEVDRQRRYIIGGTPDIEGVPVAPARQADAFMLGYLRVRIVEGPEWWSKSRGGLELSSRKVLTSLFEAVEGKISSHKAELLGRAEEARKALSKKK